MSILDYCRQVMRVVLASRPEYNLLSREQWATDVNAAIEAVQLAGCGQRTEALALASRVAERWLAV